MSQKCQLQTSKAPLPALAQRFAQSAKAIAVHNAQGFDVAKFLPPRDHSLEGFSFFEDNQFPLRRRVR